MRYGRKACSIRWVRSRRGYCACSTMPTQHALSLPFFLPFQRFLTAGVSAMSASPGVRIPLSFTGLLAPIKYPMSAPGSQVQAGWAIEVPRAWIALGVNVVTQGLCVRGVNRLTAVGRMGCGHAKWSADDAPHRGSRRSRSI